LTCLPAYRHSRRMNSDASPKSRDKSRNPASRQNHTELTRVTKRLTAELWVQSPGEVGEKARTDYSTFGYIWIHLEVCRNATTMRLQGLLSGVLVAERRALGTASRLYPALLTAFRTCFAAHSQFTAEMAAYWSYRFRRLWSQPNCNDPRKAYFSGSDSVDL